MWSKILKVSFPLRKNHFFWLKVIILQAQEGLGPCRKLDLGPPAGSPKINKNAPVTQRAHRCFVRFAYVPPRVCQGASMSAKGVQTGSQNDPKCCKIHPGTTFYEKSSKFRKVSSL